MKKLFSQNSNPKFCGVKPDTSCMIYGTICIQLSWLIEIKHSPLKINLRIYFFNCIATFAYANIDLFYQLTLIIIVCRGIIHCLIS